LLLGNNNDPNAKDWKCSACQNVNWARRDKCNRCSAPKTDDCELLEPQQRGQFGGGNRDQRPRGDYQKNNDYRSNERKGYGGMEQYNQ